MVVAGVLVPVENRHPIGGALAVVLVAGGEVEVVADLLRGDVVGGQIE